MGVEARAVMLKNQMEVEGTPEQRAYYKYLFDAIDINNNGVISFVEVKYFFDNLPEEERPSARNLIYFYKWIDMYKQGSIDFASFYRACLIHVENETVKYRKRQAKIRRMKARKRRLAKK